MFIHRSCILSFLLLNALIVVTAFSGRLDVEHPKLKTWIIGARGPNGGASHLNPNEAYAYYASLLVSVVDGGQVRGRILYTYTSFDSFAARLTGEELEVIKKKDWFIYAWSVRNVTLLPPPKGV